ncbi:MAG TPA: photosystem P840 reaction-center cytochrome c-551 [Edaphobacter sp.]|nr:photosystem P840 reaction-center cytochrome c-551 [Edaphobacter sp.]
MTMILDAPADISETDAQMIVAYLAAQSPSPDSGTGIQMEVARALVDQRCARCHTLDRVYKSVQVPDKWRETVTRMVQYAAGSSGAFEPGEAEQIIAYLSATQTPEAANLKPAQADAASASGRSLITQRKDVTPLVPAQTARRNVKSIGFISFVFLGAAALTIRRPRSRAGTAARSAPETKPMATISPRSQSSLDAVD